jgi:GT2 family glycosyltransferase
VFPPQTVLNAFKEYWLNQKDAYSKYFPKNLSPQTVWSISGGAILIRKKLFNQIGGWDERYYFYYEDLELCRQIRKLNLNIVYYPKMKVIHRHGASGTNLADDSNQWRRLIPSSKIYHGLLNHYLITLILWLSQKIFPNK